MVNCKKMRFGIVCALRWLLQFNNKFCAKEFLLQVYVVVVLFCLLLFGSLFFRVGKYRKCSLLFQYKKKLMMIFFSY